MRSSDLDRTIIIQVNTPVPDSYGEPIAAWSVLVTVPAGVKPERGSERYGNQQVNGEAVTTFKIRYRSDVTVLNRILYNGRNWDIRDVRELGRRDGLEIDATAASE